MARDEREEEAEFLRDLKVRSGQDLAAWMAAISARGFSDKNETIDWLKAQGFPFARASWLERIHSNGGRPIYLADEETPTALPPRSEVKPVSVRAVRGAPPAADNLNAPLPPPAPSAPAAPHDASRLEALIAAAKGYRPLYQLLENEIRQVEPGVRVAAEGQLIVFSTERAFAVVAATASEIRLGLDLGDRPPDANLPVARFKGAPATITHMLVLKDARQINPELNGLIGAAARRAAGPAG